MQIAVRNNDLNEETITTHATTVVAFQHKQFVQLPPGQVLAEHS